MDIKVGQKVACFSRGLGCAQGHLTVTEIAPDRIVCNGWRVFGLDGVEIENLDAYILPSPLPTALLAAQALEQAARKKLALYAELIATIKRELDE